MATADEALSAWHCDQLNILQFNVAMVAQFFKISFNLVSQQINNGLLRTGRIDCKYKKIRRAKKTRYLFK